jgi:hypothetical protein
MKQKRRTVALQCLLFLLLVWGIQPGSADAALIMADTAGADNYTTADFYGVRNLSAESFIQSVTFDITADADAFFDFDGSASFNNATAPVIGALAGLAAGDISFAFSNFVGGIPSNPAVVTFTFAPGSFGPGDSLRFSADTDWFVSDPAPGGAFGQGGAIFSAILESGQSGSTAFIKLITDASVAPIEISVPAPPVPVPAALWLLGSGLVGLFGFRRFSKT